MQKKLSIWCSKSFKRSYVIQKKLLVWVEAMVIIKLSIKGGYMTGILVSRFSEHFKCGIMQNAVVNIPFM